jgi:hypothetical protein
MITGNVECDNSKEAEFFNSIIETGLLNMDNSIKEKFKDTKINISYKWKDNE